MSGAIRETERGLGRALESLKWALSKSARPESHLAILVHNHLQAGELFEYYRNYIPPEWIKLEGIRKYILVNGSTIEVITKEELDSRKESEKPKVAKADTI